MSALGLIRRRLFGIPSAESVFRRPGFAPEAWLRFQPVAHSLVEGYHATLEDSRLSVLGPRLDAVESTVQGFAYEGAGMGLAALDLVGPWRKRLSEFVSGPGAHHIYPVYVGVGLAFARMHRSPEQQLKNLDPLLGPVVIDGYGFHEAFFAYRRTIVEHRIPRVLSPWARRLFDQGLGRAIWFSAGAVIDRVADTIAGFPATRHADLWSGVGLASAYGGGTDTASLLRLLAVAGAYRTQLARGAATAAWGRDMAGNQAAHTAMSCELICGMPAASAIAVLNDARRGLPYGGPESAYEIWRSRTEAGFATVLHEATPLAGPAGGP